MVVVGAFATSRIIFVQLIGVGLAVAFAIDATVVRALLVPATMQLLGRLELVGAGPARPVLGAVRRPRVRPARTSCAVTGGAAAKQRLTGRRHSRTPDTEERRRRGVSGVRWCAVRD